MSESFGSTVRERKTLSPSRGGSGPDGPDTILATYGILHGSTVGVSNDVAVGAGVGVGEDVGSGACLGTVVVVGDGVGVGVGVLRATVGAGVGDSAGVGLAVSDGVGMGVEEVVRADVGVLITGRRVAAGLRAQATSVSRSSDTTVTMPSDLIAAY